LLCFYEKLALYHPSILQNKCSAVCVGLSLQLLLKNEAWAIKKYEPMKVHEKKGEKRRGPMKVPEKKGRRRDSHALKKIHRERHHTKGVSISSTIIHIRAHLDLIV